VIAASALATPAFSSGNRKGTEPILCAFVKVGLTAASKVLEHCVPEHWAEAKAEANRRAAPNVQPSAMVSARVVVRCALLSALAWIEAPSGRHAAPASTLAAPVQHAPR
jgi:hypothetical protein